MENPIIIGVDFSNKNDIDTMVVGRIRNDQSIDIVNAFQGDEARELYEKLITNKSSLSMKRKDEMAVEIVRNYIIEHTDKSDPIPDFTVYIVHKRLLNKHLKYLLASTLSDEMYYDLLHIGNENEWHLNVFKIVDNVVVKEADEIRRHRYVFWKTDPGMDHRTQK